MSSISMPIPVNGATTPPTPPAANSQAQLSSENTFLKLLVAQIKNQDPTSPTDPTQFIGQLTQYSELEQLMQINSGISTIKGASPGTTPPATSSTPTPAAPVIVPHTLHPTEQNLATNLTSKI